MFDDAARDGRAQRAGARETRDIGPALRVDGRTAEPAATARQTGGRQSQHAFLGGWNRSGTNGKSLEVETDAVPADTCADGGGGPGVAQRGREQASHFGRAALPRTVAVRGRLPSRSSCTVRSRRSPGSGSRIR